MAVLVHRFLRLHSLSAIPCEDLVYHSLCKPVEVQMPKSQNTPNIPLPKAWTEQVRSAVLHVLSLAQYAAVYTRAWAADSVNTRVRLKAENDQLAQEVALLREEIRIKDARMARIGPHRHPHDPPTQRMAILELKAARGWSLEQTGRLFLLTSATIASWMKRVDAEGPDALVQLCEPVNKFPDFVRYVVQRLRILSPTMGKVKIAETLARAGLHLSVTTVGRILKEKPVPASEPTQKTETTGQVVTSKYPNLWPTTRPKRTPEPDSGRSSRLTGR